MWRASCKPLSPLGPPCRPQRGVISVESPEANRLLPRTVTAGGGGEGGGEKCRKQAQHHQLHRKVKKKSRVRAAGGVQSKGPGQERLKPERDLPYLAPRLNTRCSRHGASVRGSSESEVECQSKGKHGSGRIHPSGLFQGLYDYMLYSAFIQIYQIMF